MEEKKKLDLVSIASVPLVMTLGNSMLIPILPVIENKLKITAFQSSLIITVYSMIAIILIPFAGYLSDRFGRKKVIIPSLIITAIGGLISGLAAMLFEQSYLLILLGRFIQGIGASGTFPVVLPLIGDMFKEDRKVSSGLGLVETSNTVGKVLSPIIGAALALITWYTPLLAIPVFCLVSLVLVFFLLKVPKQQEEPVPLRTFFKNIKEIFAKKGRWLYAIFIIGCILMYVLFGVLFYLSTILEENYQIEGILKGLILAIPLLTLSLASYITGKKIGENKLLMKWVTFSGCLLLTCTIFAISFSESIYLLVGGLIFSGIGIGMALPCLDTFITGGVKKEERGTVSSIYSSMRFIGVALGPPLFAMIMKYSHQTLFLTTAAICIIASGFALISIKPKRNYNPALSE
ncbi:MFS transporter [Virgibacillus alimentarius]|uniref:ACDE family multidrug resistance protein n=1 Tax=Virgibacillus alimentarius TaxID=698769 RepID=A0ABS4S7H9_9BACI|nr:MFS transporter [Virgibacillus alimentarius]MBP2257364.1 ACDE family multidrug resistance protein [Virgibacillus alimentarius]